MFQWIVVQHYQEEPCRSSIHMTVQLSIKYLLTTVLEELESTNRTPIQTLAPVSSSLAVRLRIVLEFGRDHPAPLEQP